MAWKGKLFSGGQRGTAVHAGSFLRERRIVLDSELKGRERQRILLHELFHLAWIRLSNAQRANWRALLDREFKSRARGELGWSAEWRKIELFASLKRFGQSAQNEPAFDAGESHRRFFMLKRDYVSESFCDTAAWRYGRLREHEEFTLAPRWREKRRNWFDRTFPDARVKV